MASSSTRDISNLDVSELKTIYPGYIVEDITFFIVSKRDYVYTISKADASHSFSSNSDSRFIDNLVRKCVQRRKKIEKDSVFLFNLKLPLVRKITLEQIKKVNDYSFLRKRSKNEGYYNSTIIFYVNRKQKKIELTIFILDDFFTDNEESFEKKMPIKKIVSDYENVMRHKFLLFQKKITEENRIMYEKIKNFSENRLNLLLMVFDMSFPLKLSGADPFYNQKPTIHMKWYYLKMYDFMRGNVPNSTENQEEFEMNENVFYHKYFFHSFFDHFVTFLQKTPTENIKHQINEFFPLAIDYLGRSGRGEDQPRDYQSLSMEKRSFMRFICHYKDFGNLLTLKNEDVYDILVTNSSDNGFISDEKFREMGALNYFSYLKSKYPEHLLEFQKPILKRREDISAASERMTSPLFPKGREKHVTAPPSPLTEYIEKTEETELTESLGFEESSTLSSPETPDVNIPGLDVETPSPTIITAPFLSGPSTEDISTITTTEKIRPETVKELFPSLSDKEKILQKYDLFYVESVQILLESWSLNLKLNKEIESVITEKPKKKKIEKETGKRPVVEINPLLGF